MSSIINKLYLDYGLEKNIDFNPMYRKAFDKMNTEFDNIKRFLPKEEYGILDELFSAISEMALIESEKKFEDGFKLAMKIFCECYD